MVASINASTSAGVVTTADTSGILALQTANTTALSISASQVVTLTNALAEASGGTGTTIGYNGFKNRIINGAMVIDQRNAGASVTATATGAPAYTVDRWAYFNVAASKFSVQQNAGSVTPPAGFKNYLGVTSLAATTVASGDYYQIIQSIEGYNIADLGWGAAGASNVTLSFWVRSSLTGSFGGALLNSDSNRSYPFAYTISAANTWTQISIPISGDTTGTWLSTNGIGVQVRFSMGMGSTYTTTGGAWASGVYVAPTGSVNMVSTNGATFYITGVQLEKGSTATSFDYRPYGTELLLCQRYYQVANICGLTGGANNSTNWTANYYPPVTFRSIPTTSTATTATRITNNAVLDYFGSYPITPTPTGANFIQLAGTVSSGSNFPTTGVPLTISLPSTINLTMSAEL